MNVRMFFFVRCVQVNTMEFSKVRVGDAAKCFFFLNLISISYRHFVCMLEATENEPLNLMRPNTDSMYERHSEGSECSK